jgi:hypothetical protein
MPNGWKLAPKLWAGRQKAAIARTEIGTAKAPARSTVKFRKYRQSAGMTSAAKPGSLNRKSFLIPSLVPEQRCSSLRSWVVERSESN